MQRAYLEKTTFFLGRFAPGIHKKKHCSNRFDSASFYVFHSALCVYYTTFCPKEQDLEVLRAYAIVESPKKGGGMYYGK